MITYNAIRASVAEYQYMIYPSVSYKICMCTNACMCIYTFVVQQLCLYYYSIQQHCILDMFMLLLLIHIYSLKVHDEFDKLEYVRT